MNQLNRNIYLSIAGVAEVLFFIYTMVLYKRGIINTSDIQMGCICAGGMGVLVYFIIIGIFLLRWQSMTGFIIAFAVAMLISMETAFIIIRKTQ